MIAVRVPLAVLALALGGTAHAEQFRAFDDYEIHYNAFRADFLPQEVALAHGLTRSSERGLLNVTVLRRTEAGASAPSEATLAVTVTAGDGRSRALRMRPLIESESLNYLGEFRLQGEDTYRFEIAVSPAGTARTYRLVFAQTLVAD